MGTMSVRSKTLWLTLEIGNGDIYFFDRKRLEPKKLYGNGNKSVILFLF